MSHSTATFSSGCGPLPASRFLAGAVRPGRIVSSFKFALPRPPHPIYAMFSLLLRFCPRTNAGAALITLAAIDRRTNCRRVIVCFIGVLGDAEQMIVAAQE